MSAFLHNGGADLLAGLLGIIAFVVAGLIMARRIRSGRIKVVMEPVPQPSEVEVAAEMFYRAAAVQPTDVWLRVPRGDVRFRLTLDRGCYVVERIVPQFWPPLAGSEVRVEVMVVRTNKRYLLRQTVDILLSPQGEIPVTVTISPAGLTEFNGRLYTQAQATVLDITEWTRGVNEAKPE